MQKVNSYTQRQIRIPWDWGFFLGFLLMLIGLAACDNASDRSAADNAARAAESDTTGMPMHGMPSRAVGSGAMMEQMRTNMRVMAAVSADSLRTTMPMHRQMAAEMMAQMKTEMANSKMPVNTGWSALMDSVNQDLAQMPGMSADRLANTMPAHHARLMRLMEMHHRMIQQDSTSTR